MKEINVSTLKPGMVFSAPVYIEGDNLLVPAGIAIRKKDIDQLVSWGYDTVSTEDDPQPGEPNALSLADVQGNKGAYRRYVELIEKLDAVFDNIASGVPVESRSVDDLAGRLLQAIWEEHNHIVGFILGGEVTGHVLAKSSVNTAILSALIAAELKLFHHKVMQIVTGALLHDVGMLRLPPEVTNKSGGLSGKELQLIQTHPLLSYRIVTKELSFHDEVGTVVLQHHERWDGEGYPRHVSGGAIDMGARVVSVADAFEAMVSEKPYRNSMMGYQAMKNLLSDNSRHFDPEVLKTFYKIMGIYPIGSMIMLNNGAVARVTEVRGDAPLRPKIRILIDETGKLFKNDTGQIIDLLADKSLFIVRALDPREVSTKT
jgi:HD-GYP domain-containing protein (c-di-GMP phosphodiesterase class II)